MRQDPISPVLKALLEQMWRDVYSKMRSVAHDQMIISLGGVVRGGKIVPTAIPFPGPGYPEDVAASESDGSATLVARSDHVHAHGSGYLPDAHHAQAHAHDGVDGSGTVEHHHLTGLGDDDHTQYLNTTRHAALAHTALWPRTVIVNAAGGTDFATVKDACDYVVSQNPSNTTRWTILVLPASYDEQALTVPNYTTLTGLTLGHAARTFANSTVIRFPSTTSGACVTLGNLSVMSNLAVYFGSEIVPTGDWIAVKATSGSAYILDSYIFARATSATYNVTGLYVDTGSTALYAHRTLVIGASSSQANFRGVWVLGGICRLDRCDIVPAIAGGTGAQLAATGPHVIDGETRFSGPTGLRFTTDISLSTGTLYLGKSNANTISVSGGTLTSIDRSTGTFRGTVKAAAATDVPHTVIAAAGQSANLSEWKSSAETVLAAVSAGGRLSVADGSASTPGLAFTSDADTGIFRGGTDRCSFAFGGVEAIRLRPGTEYLFDLVKRTPLTAWLKGSVLGTPGEGVPDIGMLGVFDRVETAHAALRGTVTVTITGAGSCSGSLSNLNAAFDGVAGTFLTVTNVDATTTKIVVLVDLLVNQSVYAYAQWQPFVMYRLEMWSTATGTRATFANKITVEVSPDNSNWYKPSGGQWETTDANAAAVVPHLWLGGSAVPTGLPSYLWRYVRFTLEDLRIDPGYASKDQLWIPQMGLRHVSAPWARYYPRVSGDSFYGNVTFEKVAGAGTTIRLNQNGSAVLNEAGDAVDVRIEGDTDEQLLLTQGSTDRVGIGVSSPQEKLDVAGSIRLSGTVKVGANQVLGARVVDARADDTINDSAWDATTAGVLDAVRDAMIAHGLLAAS